MRDDTHERKPISKTKLVHNVAKVVKVLLAVRRFVAPSDVSLTVIVVHSNVKVSE